MVEIIRPFFEPHLARIEPDDRLVVLARTIQTQDPGAETALKDRVVNWARFGEACLGQALYRHRDVFRNGAEMPVWSHLELSYFRGMISVDVIFDLVDKRQLAGVDLLRAEILLTTPSSFVLPRGWHGSAGRAVSLEYIDVRSPHLSEYRDVMRRYCGPAAAKLVRANRFGTFRAMETAAVLYRDPKFKIDWNQIICARWMLATSTGSARSSQPHYRTCRTAQTSGRLRRPRPHPHGSPLDLQRSSG